MQTYAAMKMQATMRGHHQRLVASHAKKQKAMSKENANESNGLATAADGAPVSSVASNGDPLTPKGVLGLPTPCASNLDSNPAPAQMSANQVL